MGLSFVTHWDCASESDGLTSHPTSDTHIEGEKSAPLWLHIQAQGGKCELFCTQKNLLAWQSDHTHNSSNCHSIRLYWEFKAADGMQYPVTWSGPRALTILYALGWGGPLSDDLVRPCSAHWTWFCCSCTMSDKPGSLICASEVKASLVCALTPVKLTAVKCEIQHVCEAFRSHSPSALSHQKSLR